MKWFHADSFLIHRNDQDLVVNVYLHVGLSDSKPDELQHIQIICETVHQRKPLGRVTEGLVCTQLHAAHIAAIKLIGKHQCSRAPETRRRHPLHLCCPNHLRNLSKNQYLEDTATRRRRPLHLKRPSRRSKSHRRLGQRR